MAMIAPRSNVGQLTGTPGYGGGNLPGKPARPVVKRPLVAPAGGSNDSILALVRQILQLEQAPLTAAENQRQQRIAAQQADMRAAQTALVAQLQKGASTGGQVYDQAAAATDAMGRQAASYFQGQNPNAQTQANLKAIGAPLAQQQAVGASNASLFSGGPNYVLGAQIPGASLQAQKAAQVSYLAGLPTVAALQGNTGIRASQLADQQAHQTYLQDLQRVTAQTPQLVQTYQNQRVAQANAARVAAIQAGAALQNARALAFSQGLKGKQLDLATLKEQHAYDIAQQNADSTAQRAGTYATSVTNTNTNAQARNKIAANKAAAAATAKAATNRKTAKRRAVTARTAALKAALRIPTTTTVNVPGDPATLTPPGVKKVNVPYNTIHYRAMGLPEVQLLWTRYGYSRSEVSKLVDQALARHGIRPAKKRGKAPAGLGY